MLVAFGVVVTMLALAERKSASDARNSANDAHQQADIARTRSNELLLTHARSELERDPASALAWLKHYPENGNDWAGVQVLAAEINMHAIARHIWRGHPKYVAALVVSPNGRVVATGSGNLCALWDAQSGRQISTFKVPPVARLAFSADSTELAIGGSDGFVMVVGLANNTIRRLGTSSSYISALLVAPDGGIITGDVSGALQLWPLNGSPPRKLSQHSGGVYSAVLVDHGAAVAAFGGSDLVLRHVPLDGSAPSPVIDAHVLAPHYAEIASIAIGPDGRSLAIGMGDRVLRWDQGTSGPVELGRHRALVKVVVMAAGGRVVSGAEDGSITSWSTSGPPRQLRGHIHAITSIAVDRDSERIASGDTSGEVHVWTSVGDELLRGHNGRIQEIVFGPDHLVLSSSTDKTVRAWLPTQLPIATIPTGAGSIFGLAFLSSTTLVATQADSSVQLVSLVTNKSRNIKRYARQAYGVQLLPGKRFATSSWDGSVPVFAADASELLHFDHGAEINCLAASTDGTYLATTGTDGATWLWNISEGKGRSLERRSSETQDVVFSLDGHLLASSGADFELHVFDLTERTGPRKFTGHTDVARSLMFSRDGRVLYSAGADGTVRVWSLDPGAHAPNRTLRGHEGAILTLALSSDQRYLSSAGVDGTIISWDLLDGYRVRYLRGHTGTVHHITYLSGSHLLASAGWDGTVRVWNLDDDSVAGWRADEDKVLHVEFSPDGKFLASGGADGNIRLWPLVDQRFIPSKHDLLTRWIAEATTATVTNQRKLEISEKESIHD